MAISLDRWWLWLTANMIGMALFLQLALPTWIEPELADEPGANGGEFLIWAASALPIFLLFILAHCALGFVAHRQFRAGGSWRGTMFVGFTLACWIVIFVFDNAHHGN
jgi:hypothetical protein